MGASLALSVETYRAVGGVPLVALAEDRALAHAVERAGFRLRRSHAPLVFTSPRLCGRAPGGFADLLSSHAEVSSPCDAALEHAPAMSAATIIGRMTTVHSRSDVANTMRSISGSMLSLLLRDLWQSIKAGLANGSTGVFAS